MLDGATFHGSTRIDAWTCPLCGWRVAGTDVRTEAVAHGVTEHPARLPARMTTAQRLAWLPMLAAEVRATTGAPNPSDRAMPASAPHGDSERVPADLASLCALAPAESRSVAYGDPAEVLVRCSRLVWEAVDNDVRRDHPQPLGVPTVESESTWLASVWDDAQAVLDLSVIEWISSDIAEVCATLAALARTLPAPVVPCLVEGCGGHIPALGETSDGWLWADVCSENHRVDRHAIARRWRETQPVTLAEAAQAVGVTDRTLRNWLASGLLQPAGRRGKGTTVRVDDVRRVVRLVREKSA